METIRTQVRSDLNMNWSDETSVFSVLTVLLVPQRTPSLPSAAPELHRLQDGIRKQVDKKKLQAPGQFERSDHRPLT